MTLVLSSIGGEHRFVRADQAIERAAGVAVDERKSAGEQSPMCTTFALLEADDDVGLGVRVRQVRELEVFVVEMQRRRVGERDHGQRLARAGRDGLRWWTDSPASVPRRLRTFSCAMITAPALPKASLPPV